MRIPIIDGFRGFFLLFMMIIHTNMEVDSIVGKLNHHYFGWVEDAQGFVFISGVVVGMVYGGKLLRGTFSGMAGQIYSRIGTIYRHHAFLIILFLGAALLFSQFDQSVAILSSYQDAPGLFGAASLALVSASKHMGILAMYIYFLAVTPLALLALHRGAWRSVLLLSGLVWVIGQTSFVDLADQRLEAGLAQSGAPIAVGLFFNLLGWQLIFFVGVIFGYRHRAGQLDLSFLQTKRAMQAAVASVVLVAAFGLFDRIVYWELISPAFSDTVLAYAVRSDFSALHLANFAVDLYLVTWLVVAGPSCGIKVFAVLSRIMKQVFCWPPLVMLGQHSLRLFTYHLVFIYVLATVLNGRPVAEGTATLIVLASVGLLFGLGHLERWMAQRNSQKPQTAQPPVPAT